MKTYNVCSVGCVGVLLLVCLTLRSAEGVCTPGYEPTSGFPGCVVRQSNVFDTVFAILTGGRVTDNHSGQCVTSSQASTLWTAGATIGSRVGLLRALQGCFNSTSYMCYDDVRANYYCGCLEDCLTVNTALFDANYYAFNNLIQV